MNFVKQIRLLLLFFFITIQCNAAEDKPVEGIVVGINGTENIYIDIGYCFGKRINWFSSDMLKGYGGLTIGTEITRTDRIIIAPKLAYSINMFVSFGVNLVYYTDLSTATLEFRPEIGVSTLGVRAIFGRNFSVGNYPFVGVNKNNYAITMLIPL